MAEKKELVGGKDAVERAAQRERIRLARQDSDKEPFDFARLCELYAPMALPALKTLPEAMADDLEEDYYRNWSEVKTLEQAAIQWRWQNQTPGEREAEMWERIRQRNEKHKAAQRERIRLARQESDKEPFDFARLCLLYAPLADPLKPLQESMADSLEESYYTSWSEVKTLQQAAEYLQWLNTYDVT